MTRDYETKARSIQCLLQDYGSGLPAWLDKQECSPLPGQRMIWFGDVKGRKLVGWKRALYSATGRYVIVQCEIEWEGELESNGIEWNTNLPVMKESTKPKPDHPMPFAGCYGSGLPAWLDKQERSPLMG